MALLFLDGFDKYGGVNSNGASVQALLQQEWTTAASANLSIVAGLSVTGSALSTGSGAAVTKTLAGNYGRLIGGVRFSSNLLTASSGIQFIDAASNQAAISINTAGTISVRSGVYNGGTVLGTSTATVAANSVHYLEWDITFSNTGTYQVWLDGVSILGPASGDTTATTNNTASGVQLAAPSGSGVTIWDDFYLFDNSGTTNNAVLLTSPRIETTFPNADAAVQFAIGAATLGNSVARGIAFSLSANQLYVRPYTPTRNCTLNSLGLLGNANSGAVNIKPLVYADVAGTPNGGALLSTGSAVTGITAGAITTLPLTTPQSLVAGTQYWLGYITDTSVVSGTVGNDPNLSGRVFSSTFTTPPSTCPATAGGNTSVAVYGNITLASPANYYEVASQPPQGVQSYVFDATVGHEDLYTLPMLSAPATVIYAVAVKANVAKSDAGTKTVSVRGKSGATDSAGTVTSFAPATTFGWLDTLFETDPATGVAWTLTAVNAMQIGVRVET